MTAGHEPEEIPSGWDQLADRTIDPGAGPADEPPLPRGARRRGPLVLAAVADLVTILVICAGAVAALRLGGFRTGVPVVPWAAALAVAWWLTASSILVAVRRGTPGMLASGLAFTRPVPTGRIGPTVLAALLSTLLLGVPVAVGGARSVVEAAAGSRVSAQGLDDPGSV